MKVLMTILSAISILSTEAALAGQGAWVLDLAKVNNVTIASTTGLLETKKIAISNTSRGKVARIGNEVFREENLDVIGFPNQRTPGVGAYRTGFRSFLIILDRRGTEIFSLLFPESGNGTIELLYQEDEGRTPVSVGLFTRSPGL